jgi:ATP-dependent DNA ligase
MTAIGCSPASKRKQGDRLTLWTRHGTKFNDRLRRIAEAVRSLSIEQALIDGEAVVFRPDGRTDFEALLTKRGAGRAAYVAFDLLRLDGADIRQNGSVANLREDETRDSGALKAYAARA